MKKQDVAFLFDVDVKNISSFSIEKTMELRQGTTIEDFGMVWQMSTVRANLKKPINTGNHGWGNCKLEKEIWDLIPEMEY